MAKSPLFGQNVLRKAARWRPPDFNEKLKIVKKVDRMSKMCMKVIIRDYSLIQDYQLDHFGKKSTSL